MVLKQKEATHSLLAWPSNHYPADFLMIANLSPRKSNMSSFYPVLQPSKGLIVANFILSTCQEDRQTPPKCLKQKRFDQVLYNSIPGTRHRDGKNCFVGRNAPTMLCLGFTIFEATLNFSSTLNIVIWIWLSSTTASYCYKLLLRNFNMTWIHQCSWRHHCQ